MQLDPTSRPLGSADGKEAAQNSVPSHSMPTADADPAAGASACHSRAAAMLLSKSLSQPCRHASTLSHARVCMLPGLGWQLPLLAAVTRHVVAAPGFLGHS